MSTVHQLLLILWYIAQTFFWFGIIVLLVAGYAMTVFGIPYLLWRWAKKRRTPAQ